MKVRSALAAASIAVMAMASTALAETTVLVTQNTTTWTEDDTRPGGEVSWSAAYGAPAGLGSSALRLTTDNTNAAKAGLYNHEMAPMPLGDVNNLAYWTYQQSANFPGGAPSFQVQIFALGGADGFTTLVYEPYQNGSVVNGQWQAWDVDEGQFWSSRNVTDAGGDCDLTAGAGGAPFYTLADLVADCPNAVVVGIGVNVGTYNPDYDTATDGVRLNGTTYDFEIGTSPSTKNECKQGGWATFNDPAFKNQGDCVSWVNTGN
jgi:hypothetical protein